MIHRIECALHGAQEQTFVCRHLVESLRSGEKVGFCCSSEPRGYAWCNACEEVRIGEGGKTGEWNDRSEAFAKVTLLCGACYDEIRKLNLG